MTDRLTDADEVARRIVAATDGEIRLALPLGLGKPVTLVNALTRLAGEERSIRLEIFTALTLERPRPSSDLEKRFLGPAMDRLFGRYPGLDYARMLHDGTLPDNITVNEFFFQAGAWLGESAAQRAYISANYTHARDVLISRRPNVVMQLLAETDDLLSLSCNTDITADLLRFRREGRMDFLMAGEVNDALPFMEGPALVEAGEVALLLDPPEHFELFSKVREPVSTAQHAIGAHVARLVPDGGTLQIGIGAIGDAVAHALLVRERGRAGEIWRDAPFPSTGDEAGPFRTGLYAVTEMLVGGLLALYEAGVIRRKVDGAAIHAAFFVETRDFYARLREMQPDARAGIAMMPVSFTNALYGDEEAKRAARVDARFVNGAMQASLLGDVMSDASTPGQVVSGVGGQFNFVDQAFALVGARSIVTLSATRTSRGKTSSNIAWSVPVTTVPRHLRDMVVTEYGVADLRGQPDEEVIARMICIADSRFQDGLLESAREAGKISREWKVPARHRSNLPATLDQWLDPFRADELPDFPFGTDFDPIERALLPALALLKSIKGNRRASLRPLAASLTRKRHPDESAAMTRMSFSATPTLTEPLQARALRGALRLVAGNAGRR